MSTTDSAPSEQLANWRAQAVHWEAKPENFLSHGNKALELGQPSLAYDIYAEGLNQNTDHVELLYRSALALARCKSTLAAISAVDKLLSILPTGSALLADAHSLAGRLAKDQWAATNDQSRKHEYALRSAQAYQQAYALSHDYYPGINAASMAIVSGNKTHAKQLATTIKALCTEAMVGASSSDYWLTATLGEACLLLDEQDAAKHWYSKAVEAINGDYGNQAVIYRQVKLLNDFIDVDADLLERLAIPKVAVFTGHMIDAPDRLTPRFTADMEAGVKHAIADAIRQQNIKFGYCSAACGADIIFIETLLALGGEVHIVLPFKEEDFIATSVEFAGANWVPRFHAALEQASTVSYATEEGYLNDDALFEYCNALAAGLARLKADILESEAVLLAVADPASLSSTGGAMQMLQQWQQANRRSQLINLKLLQSFDAKEVAHRTHTEQAATPMANSLARTVKTMVFADVVGFSALGEAEAPSFFVHFLEHVNTAIKQQHTQPTFVNTWGDGLFLVYDDLCAAANAALSLRDAVLEHNWETHGLPKTTSIRIGMHTGPVYEAMDPIIEQQNFYGSHVNRAARIEPVAVPGSVFISEQSACLLSLQNNTGLHCDYLGEMPLAKKYGSSVLYRLRRSDELE